MFDKVEPEEALLRIVRDAVDELGLLGAALWQEEDGELVALCAAGAVIPESLVRAARADEQEDGDASAWPLADARGVFAVRGDLSGPLRAVARMLAGHCAVILAAARRDATQRNLLAGLGHELRAPLQSLLGTVDLLRDGTFGELGAEQAEALAAVTRNAEKILAVSRDVLQVARIDSGKEKVVVDDVDLEALVEAEVDSARPLADGLTLRAECPAGLSARSDGAKVARILTNLLSNAAKYTRAGEVVVTAGRSSEGVFVEVADTGPGIPSDKQEEVFEEYVRLGGDADGTGLGLAIARRLAKLLSGRLTLASEVGRGTTVRLDLPDEAGPTA